VLSDLRCALAARNDRSKRARWRQRHPWAGARQKLGPLALLEAAAGGFYLGLGGGAVGPGGAFDALARLQLLVDQEEVLDLQPVEPRQVVQVLQVLLARVAGRVLGRGEQGAVQADQAGFVVDLVLVPAAARDLDPDVESMVIRKAAC